MLRRSLPVALAAVLLAGCGGSNGDESLLGPGEATPTPSPSRTVATPQTPQRLVDALARSLRRHDRARFSALVSTRHPRFRAAQERLFDNLRRLPLSGLGFTVDERGEVTRTLRLGSYDRRPMVGPAGFRVGRQNGRLVVVPGTGAQPRDPWDLTAVRVAADDRVLVVTDATHGDLAPRLLGAAHTALDAVAAAVPLPWSRTAVVYAFTEQAVTATYGRVRSASTAHLGALTYLRRDDAGRALGTRVALLSDAFTARPAQLRRLLRHEITHVALGEEGLRLPTWLAEGVAEHVATSPIRRADQQLPTVAVDTASYGTVTLPVSADFHGDQEALNYAVAQVACDVLADRGKLWDTVSAMQAARIGVDGQGQDGVLLRVAGLDSIGLADAVAARIRRLYG